MNWQWNAPQGQDFSDLFRVSKKRRPVDDLAPNTNTTQPQRIRETGPTASVRARKVILILISSYRGRCRTLWSDDVYYIFNGNDCGDFFDRFLLRTLIKNLFETKLLERSVNLDRPPFHTINHHEEFFISQNLTRTINFLLIATKITRWARLEMLFDVLCSTAVNFAAKISHILSLLIGVYCTKRRTGRTSNSSQ